MIIWRNEMQSPTAAYPGITKDPPEGPIEITRVKEAGGNYHIWFAPVPPVPAVPAATDEDHIRDAMAEAQDHPGRIVTR